MPINKKASKGSGWDSPENEAQNNFISWGAPGDFVYGTLTGTRKVKSTLPGKENELQTIYEIKVRECEYHIIDENKDVAEEATVLSKNDVISVGGRSTIDGRMARAKTGQIVGLKFIEEQASKKKGFNPTKVIRVYLPKLDNGDFEMDEEFLASKADSLDQFDAGDDK